MLPQGQEKRGETDSFTRLRGRKTNYRNERKLIEQRRDHVLGT